MGNRSTQEKGGDIIFEFRQKAEQLLSNGNLNKWEALATIHLIESIEKAYCNYDRHVNKDFSSTNCVTVCEPKEWNKVTTNTLQLQDIITKLLELPDEYQKFHIVESDEEQYVLAEDMKRQCIVVSHEPIITDIKT